jgi:hypothetical protein
MSPAPPERPGAGAPPRPARPLRLRDLAALVLGYGLASLLVRSYWPNARLPGGSALLALAVVFAWLGLAMSGPFLIPWRRNGGRPATSWAEATWVGIGSYWIGLLACGLLARVSVRPLAFAGAASGLMIVVAWARPGHRRVPAAPGRWTEPVALGVLLAWPPVWAALAYLGSTLR